MSQCSRNIYAYWKNLNAEVGEEFMQKLVPLTVLEVVELKRLWRVGSSEMLQ